MTKRKSLSLLSFVGVVNNGFLMLVLLYMFSQIDSVYMQGSVVVATVILLLVRSLIYGTAENIRLSMKTHEE